MRWKQCDWRRRRSADDLVALQLIIDRSRMHLRQRRNLADDDEAFRLTLIGAAKNPILLRIGTSQYSMIRSIRCRSCEAAGSGAQPRKDHVKIPGAVAQRDADAAKRVKHHYGVSSLRWRRAFAAGHRQRRMAGTPPQRSGPLTLPFIARP
jgi:DNA-binding FadR family transcriptional regulator